VVKPKRRGRPKKKKPATLRLHHFLDNLCRALIVAMLMPTSTDPR